MVKRTVNTRNVMRLTTAGAALRGAGSVVDFWPMRAIHLGGQSSDADRLAGDWHAVGDDVRSAMSHEQKTSTAGHSS